MSTISETPLNRAIREAGGISALARELGLSGHAVIHQWRINRVPAERCPAIEAATGGLVRCEDLRPDVAWHVLRQKAAQPSAERASGAIETKAA